MYTYAFFEICHTAGVPHKRHILEREFKTDKQAIRAAEREKVLRHASIIDVFGWNEDGNREKVKTFKTVTTETGEEFIEVL